MNENPIPGTNTAPADPPPAPAANGTAAPQGQGAPVWQQAPQNPGAGQPFQANPYAGQPQYQPPYPQGYPVPPKKVQHRRGTPRDLILAVILAVVSFIMTDCVLWAGTLGLGFALCAVVLLAVSLWYLRPVWRHTGLYTVMCFLLFAAGAVSMVFSADAGAKALTFFCLMILYACILMDGMSLRSWAAGTFFSIGDFFYTAFAASFGKIGAGMYGLFHREKDPNAKSKAGIGKALLGLLIALPFAAILIVLLSIADEAFKGMISGIDLGNFPQKFTSLILAIPLFILLFCQLFGMQEIRRTKRQESDKGLDPTVLTFFLIGISLVYVAYLFSQLAYFFSGFMGFLPEKYTYAEYARRGFFELSAVSIINILIVILASALSKKQNGKLPLGVRLTNLFLCLFSLVLVGTEVAKMKMYMDSYGLTRLRILTTLFMIFLAVVFLALSVHLFVRRFPYLKIAVVCSVLLAVSVNFVSVDRMVAEYNVWAYQTGVLSTVDVDTVTSLGDAAVPALLKLAEDDNPNVAKQAQSDLHRRWNRLHIYGDVFEYRIGELKAYDWRGFNTVSYQTRQLLLDNESLFLRTPANN